MIVNDLIILIPMNTMSNQNKSVTVEQVCECSDDINPIMSIHSQKSLRHRRIGWNSLFFSDDEYSYYLRFDVSVQFNNLNPKYDRSKYSKEQEETRKLIQSLHGSGMGYRKISHYLNEKGIMTIEGNRWKNTTVHSVLKRYRERQERLKLRNKRYKPTRSKMWLEYSKS